MAGEDAGEDEGKAHIRACKVVCNKETRRIFLKSGTRFPGFGQR
jgi:hypothetical protein